MEKILKKEVDWEWDGIIIYNSSKMKLKCELQCEGGTRGYVKEEHSGWGTLVQKQGSN